MKRIIYNLNEIEQLSLGDNEEHHLVYKTEHFEYNLLVFVKKQFNNLIVFSNGAVDYKKKNPPIFMRSTWSNEIKGNLIYLDDPTIHNTDLSIGWGQGNENEFVLNIYSEIVKRISKILNVKSEDTCYYGSSAGGFMSMILASKQKESFAVVNNPQTDIISYYSDHSHPLLNLVYSDTSRPYKEFIERVNVVKAFQYSNYVPHIFYFQNQYSPFDLKFHVNPFIRDMKESELDLKNIVFINYFDVERGHTPLANYPAIESLNMIITNKLFKI